MNGLEAVRGKDGLWRLRYLRPSGGYVKDGGEVVTFGTKAEALRSRRQREGVMTEVPRSRENFFAGRVDRRQRRR